MVIGGRTLAAIEAMASTAERCGVRIAALVSTDPLQRLDFADVFSRVAPSRGAVFDEEAAARRFIGG